MADCNNNTQRATDEEIFQRDGFTCVYCDFDGSDFKSWSFLQVDHFLPVSKGGTNEASNLVTACCICNHMKLDRTFDSIEEARKEIQKWWTQMEAYWKENVRWRLKAEK